LGQAWRSIARSGASLGASQYLISVRDSVFQHLSGHYPVYQQTYRLAQSSNPVAFRLD